MGEVCRVPLSQGQVALVDACDYERVAAYSWSYKPHGRTAYAQTSVSRDGKARTLLMHRLIVSAPAGTCVDHINGNGIDNRRANLRYATASQNCANQRLSRNNTSGFKGVSFRRESGKWRARIMRNREPITIGQYETKEDAASAYNEAAIRLHGPFAHLNPVDGLLVGGRWSA